MTQEKGTTTIAPPRRGLGRGLDSLIPAAGRVRTPVAAAAPVPAPIAGEQIEKIPVDQIDPNPYQPRLRMDEAALAELAASIKESGVLQPIVVRRREDGRYQLIAGERRWMASQRAGKTTVPAIVRQVSNEQAMELTIIENLQREDLNPMEHARAFDRLGREFGLTQEQMAQRTGKERTTIANYLRLLKLPEEVQELLERGQVSFGHAKVMMALPTQAMIRSMAERIVKDGLSVRATEELVFQANNPQPAAAPAERSRPAVDPNVRQAEKELQRALGCRVTIRDRNGKGKIVIQYGSLEDFDRVVEVLSAR